MHSIPNHIPANRTTSGLDREDFFSFLILAPLLRGIHMSGQRI